MNFWRPLPWILSAGLVAAGCEKSPPASQAAPPPSTAAALEIDPTHGHLLHAQPRLPTLKLFLGDQELSAEIASRNLEIATGMMYRTNMSEGTAMIFVFGDAASRSFYMRNCFVPLSGAYLSPAGEILQIVEMKPQDETPIPSTANNIQFVIEVPQGWFARHHLAPGVVVRTERGTLQETFFRPR